MDLTSPQKSVFAFKAGGATIAGTSGARLGRDGTVYVSTSDGSAPLSSSLIALEPRTLKMKASIRVPKANFRSSPLALQWKDRDIVVAADGRTVFLFDTASLQDGPVANATVESASPDAGALASWVDRQNTQWLAVSSTRAIVSFKVVEQDGRVALQSGWTSRAIAAPLRPLIVNGVMFVASSGTRTAPAVLYAIDAATGYGRCPASAAVLRCEIPREAPVVLRPERMLRTGHSHFAYRYTAFTVLCHCSP